REGSARLGEAAPLHAVHPATVLRLELGGVTRALLTVALLAAGQVQVHDVSSCAVEARGSPRASKPTWLAEQCPPGRPKESGRLDSAPATLAQPKSDYRDHPTAQECLRSGAPHGPTLGRRP